LIRSTSELLEALRTEPHLLIGTPEDTWVDFKGEPYRLTEDWWKLELAKDVSAIANVGAGCIVVGVATNEEPDTRRDVASALRPVPPGHFDPKQVRDVVYDRVFPRLDLDIEPHSLNDDSEGRIWSITILPQARDLPYVVVGEKPVNDRGISGRYFAIYERSHSEAVPYRPEQVHGWIQRGRTPLAALVGVDHEQIIGEHQGISEEVLERDLKALELQDDESLFFLQASPNAMLTIPNFFGGTPDSVAAVLETPPWIRPDGFSLHGHAGIEHVGDGLRRTVPNGGSLSVTRGGICTLIYGQRYLCWAHETRTPGKVSINNLLLSEVTLDFWRLYMGDLIPRMEREQGGVLVTKWRVGLQRTQPMPPANLPLFLPDEFGFALTTRTTAADFITEWRTAENKTAEQVAYDVVSEVYARFGYNESVILGARGNRIEPDAVLAYTRR
jgi:hypothetical protein